MRDAIVDHCHQMIRDGSKSFAGAARLFDSKTRAAAYELYAWCRYCDDQVDDEFLGRPGGAGVCAARAGRLRSVLERTRMALDASPPPEPAFQALHRVVAEYQIPHRLPFELIEGFAMDVEGRRYAEPEDVYSYSYHVAGTVGLMMAHVMGVRDRPTLRRAADLGIALQMTNIARDVVDDARAQRVYLPLRWLEEERLPVAEIAETHHRPRLARVVERLLREADRYYQSGNEGLARLPLRSAWATVVARGVYSEIGNIVRSRGPRAWDERAVVPRRRKLAWVGRGLIEALFRVTVSRRRREAPRPDLWMKGHWLD